MESDLLELSFGNNVQTSVLFSEYINHFALCSNGTEFNQNKYEQTKGNGWIKVNPPPPIKSEYSSGKSLPQKDAEVN